MNHWTNLLSQRLINIRIIVGLMHQVKTQSSRRGPHYAESTSSKTSTKRKTVGGHEQNMDIATTKEIGKFDFFRSILFFYSLIFYFL